MKPQILRLDESALYALGMDRVTVNALRNMIRVTGTDNATPTVPEVAEAAGVAGQLISKLREQVDLIQGVLDILEASPPAQIPDFSMFDGLLSSPLPSVSTVSVVSQQSESLIIEVRQIAEAVANIGQYIQAEVRQNSERISQIAEHLTTEVRQIADQQVTNANLIQELKQGTML